MNHGIKLILFFAGATLVATEMCKNGCSEFSKFKMEVNGQEMDLLSMMEGQADAMCPNGAVDCGDGMACHTITGSMSGDMPTGSMEAAFRSWVCIDASGTVSAEMCDMIEDFAEQVTSGAADGGLENVKFEIDCGSSSAMGFGVSTILLLAVSCIMY